MGGKICNTKNETCKGTVENAKDNNCCIGSCVAKEVDNSGKWIGWLLLIIVIFSIGYALIKNKGKKGKGFSLPSGNK